MIRDALVREVTFGGTTCPTEEVCCLMAAFLQRLPLPRLVHFLDMILPQMVPVIQEGDGLRHPIVSQNVLQEVSMEWNTHSMWSSSTGPGRASCMSQLPGTINLFCFWLLHCSRSVLLNPSKWRLDLRMTSNGFKWGCAQAILSLSVSGGELATTKVY